MALKPYTPPERTMTKLHVSLIRPGDLVLHNGVERTVCQKDLTKIEGMGRALFGDTYALGTKPVTVIVGMRK